MTIRKNSHKQIAEILNAAVLIREIAINDMSDTNAAVTPARVIEAGSDPQMSWERIYQNDGVTNFVIHRNWMFVAYESIEAARSHLTAVAFAKYFPEVVA